MPPLQASHRHTNRRHNDHHHEAQQQPLYSTFPATVSSSSRRRRTTEQILLQQQQFGRAGGGGSSRTASVSDDGSTLTVSPQLYDFVTVEDNRIYKGKINRDIFSQAPIPVTAAAAAKGKSGSSAFQRGRIFGNIRSGAGNSRGGIIGKDNNSSGSESDKQQRQRGGTKTSFQDSFMVLSQRDVVVGPNPLYARMYLDSLLLRGRNNDDDLGNSSNSSGRGSSNSNNENMRDDDNDVDDLIRHRGATSSSASAISGRIQPVVTKRGTSSSPKVLTLMDMMTNMCVCPNDAASVAAAAANGGGVRVVGVSGELGCGIQQQQHRNSQQHSSLKLLHPQHDPKACSSIPIDVVDAEMNRKIVYPVARYPARLNSPEMVEQRRNSLRRHLTFKPVKSSKSAAAAEMQL